MGRFFNVDNGFFSFLSKVCDIIFISVVYLIICIPVITIGPASTALYYATVKVIRRERGYLFREFFKSFRMNFKRAAIVGVVLTVAYIILAVDILSSWAGINGTSGSILFGVYIAITIIVAGFTTYVFPVLSRFEMTVKQLVKTVFFISMKHLPSTICMLIISAAGIAGCLFIPLLIFIMPATVTFINSFLMERILKKYMPKSENSEENTTIDEWYLE